MRRKDETKNEAIFDATLQLVQDHGLAGVTMCDISRAAGIATGTLYIYFENKEKLMNELFAICRQESAKYYLNGYTGSEGFHEGFRVIFQNIVQYRIEQFEKFVFLEQCYHSPFITEAVRKKSLQALNPIFKLLQRGKEEGVIKQLDDELLLGYILGPINEVIKKSHYAQKAVDSKRIECLYQLCLDGIKASS